MFFGTKRALVAQQVVFVRNRFKMLKGSSSVERFYAEHPLSLCVLQMFVKLAICMVYVMDF